MADSLDIKSLKLIHKFTEGNYRECNKLMFTVLEICAYYQNNEPTRLEKDKISTRIIEMAALKLGYIHA